MSAERLSYLKALHCVRLWAGEWRQPELGNHCGVNGLLLGGYIVSPTVYFPLYISKLAVFFFHALVHLWTGNVWKNMSNMVMCSLNLWMAKRRLQLVHYIMSNSSVPFLWASTSIYKFRSTTGERGKKSASYLLFGIWASVFFLISSSDQSCWRNMSFFPPFSLSWNALSLCTVSPRAICTHVTLHLASSSQQSRLILVDSGRVAVSPLTLAGHWSNSTPPVLRSNPLNPSECSVLLAVPVERENTVANAVAAPNITGWGRHGWFIII